MSEQRPEASPDMPEFYRRYITLFPNCELALENLASLNVESWLKKHPDLSITQPYGPGKWNVLQILRHLLDAERVFQFRALWIARGSAEALPGYDQDAWAGHYSGLTEAHHLPGLLEEYRAVRHSSLLLARTFSAEDWARKGSANGITMTPAFLYQCMAGHESHHIAVLEAHLPTLLSP